MAVVDAEIGELFGFYRDLLDESRQRPPQGTDLGALAAFLHSLYSGLENLFRRIAIELDGGVPTGGDWHRRLLAAMTTATENRPPVISDELHGRLLEYLDFRHLFRNLYVYRLQWERMEDLVLHADGTWGDLTNELTRFTERMEERQGS